MLPIEIQMQIDIMAGDAKGEIAKGFAALRERLLPEPDPWRAQWLAYNQGMRADPRGNWANANANVHPLWDMSKPEIRDAHVSALCMGIVLPWIAAR